MNMKLLKKINKANWVLFWVCLLMTLLVLYFHIYTFIPSDLTKYGVLIISGLYMCSMLIVSTILWLEKKLPNQNIKIFTIKNILKYSDNGLGLRFVFILISGLMLGITLAVATSGFYTNILGVNIERTELVLYKTAHMGSKLRRGKISGQYSAGLSNINKNINISVSDYYLLQKGKRVKIIGKKSIFGLLINKFTRA